MIDVNKENLPFLCRFCLRSGNNSIWNLSRPHSNFAILGGKDILELERVLFD